jgi:hypothetical protein
MIQGGPASLGEVNKGPEDGRTTALGLVCHGRSYLCAAEILFPHTDRSHDDSLEFNDPVIFLALHGVELFLKGFLRAHGCTVERLRQHYGHNLKKLLRASIKICLADHLPDPAELQRHVDLYGPTYGAKGFEYLKTGPGLLLEDGLLREARRLHGAVLPICFKATTHNKLTGFRLEEAKLDLEGRTIIRG